MRSPIDEALLTMTGAGEAGGAGGAGSRVIALIWTELNAAAI